MPEPKKKTSPQTSISSAEWSVMKVVWRQGAVTANGVVAALAGATDWKPKTIHTLLSRLVKKGVLEAKRQGREYLFRPLVEESDCRHAQSRSFLERVFDGRIAPFVACFMERGDLTEDEVRELKKLLAQQKK